MSPLLLPDIAGMLILMGVMAFLRRKYKDSSVDLWLLGLTFILIEAVAVAVFRGSPALTNVSHAVALIAYLLAAVTFGWAARQDLIPGQSHLPLFLPPAVPLLLLTTIYGFNIDTAGPYVAVTLGSVFLGALYIGLFFRIPLRPRAAMLLIHFVIWIPMAVMAHRGLLRGMVYWGLGCLYVLVAFSFRKRVRRDGVGGIVIVAGFLIWAGCFFLHPILRSHPDANAVLTEIWSMQKFFVIIGMLLVLLEDQTRRREMEAMHDQLTGLPNRRLFDDRLSQSLERARRTQRSTAVFIVDLNGFKLINDTYGHTTGDRVLVEAGELLRGNIRSSDTLARWGGDEFSVIVNDLQRREDCDRIAEALRLAVLSVPVPKGVDNGLSGSVGYAVFPDDVSDATELCELADVRMYKEKRESSGQRQAFVPPAERTA